MSRSLAIVLSLCTSCATAPDPTYEPLIPPRHRPEEVSKDPEDPRRLPEDPFVMSLPEGMPPGEWVRSLEAGDTAPQSGIFMSESKAWRLGQHKIAEEHLRKLATSDREVWRTHRSFYEAGAVEARKKIRDLQPNWLERNAVVLGIVGGFVLGSGVTIGVLAATQAVRND